MLRGLVRLGGHPFEEPGVGEGRRAAGGERGVLEGHALRGKHSGGGFATRGGFLLAVYFLCFRIRNNFVGVVIVVAL